MPLSPSDLVTLSRLLDEVMDLDPVQEQAWLNHLPEEHAHLRPRLQEMLTARRADSAPGFLGSGPKLSASGDETVASIGDVVGPYRLIREIGRGGMGAVWLAERADGTLKRQVALKLPRLAWGSGLAARMVRERDIGALLEHPNIARLYDAGVDERGRPYLALEHIDGQPLDAWCEAHALGVPERLRLFVQVARAVAYAHGRLVVHRDLKPSNVLVTVDGQAHLLDFGIAKLLDDAGDEKLTQQQGRVMTPQYASPEQVAGEAVTVQSDVYSLGVLLYELLTGVLPIEPRRATPGSMEEAILQGDAPLASSRVKQRATAKALRGEVDAILAKALQRETARRYTTVEAMAQDVERHLNGETVSARPDSVLYRLRKAARRHWVALGATVMVAAALTAGGTVAVIQARRAAQQAERATLARQFVAELFRASAQTPRSGSASTMLDKGAGLIEARFPGQPETQAELFGVVGRAYADLGASQAAIDFARRELTLLEPRPDNADRRAQTLLLLARSSMAEQLDDQAERYATQALQTLPPSDPVWGDAQVLLARAQSLRGKLVAAREAVARLERDLPASGRDISAAMAWTLWAKGDLQDDSAVRLALRQQALATVLKAEGPESADAIDMRLRLMIWLVALNRPDEAAIHREAALTSLRSMGGAHAVRAAVEEVKDWGMRCDMLLASHAEATAGIARQRRTVLASGLALPRDLVARIDLEQAGCEMRWGALDEAARLIGASAPVLLEESQSLAGRATVMANAGWVASWRGEHEQADTWLRERLRLHIEQGDGEAGPTVFAWAFLAMNQVMRGDLTSAREILDRAPRFQAWTADPTSGDGYARLLPELAARIELEAGHADLAHRVMPPLPPNGIDDQATFPEYALRGEIDCARGHRSDGLATLRQSIRSISALLGPDEVGLARIRAVAGLCALAMGRRHEAAELAVVARRALASHSRSSPWFGRPLTELEERLGRR